MQGIVTPLKHNIINNKLRSISYQHDSKHNYGLHTGIKVYILVDGQIQSESGSLESQK